MPELSLPEVPVDGGATLACGARGRIAAGPLFPRRIHSAGAIGAVAYQNRAKVYGLLFKAAAETLTTIAADPRHLGAKIGLTAAAHLGEKP